MSNVAEALIDNELFDNSVKTEFSSQDEAQKQEIKDRTEFLKIEFKKYQRNRILLDAIKDCVEDDAIFDEKLRDKVKNIVLGEEVSQVCLGNSSSDDPSQFLLGIAPKSTQLTYPESSRLQTCVKAKLDEKYSKLNGEDTTGSTKSQSPFELGDDDTVLLEYKNKLINEENLCHKNQLELIQLLEELKNIRLTTVPEITNQKVEECKLITKINYLKSQLADQKCRTDIFMETNNSLKAYTEVIKDLKEQQKEFKFEIDRLKDLKQKYTQVSCREFDDILKSYVQYKTAFEKRKMMYEMYS